MTGLPFPTDGATPAVGLSDVTWEVLGIEHAAPWRSEGQPAPRRTVVGDDRLTAAAALRLVSAETAILWQGDFQNARQLLRALARRIDGARARAGEPAAESAESLASAFHRHRRERSRRAHLLGLLVVLVDPDGSVSLRRAPDLRAAYLEAFDQEVVPVVRSLQELLGAVGAHEWRTKGVDVPALGGTIHPHYGVFSPCAASTSISSPRRRCR